MKTTLAVFQSNANTTFDKLFLDWGTWAQGDNPYDQKGPGFWHVGNVTHACLDYFDAVRPDDLRKRKLMTILKDSYALFNAYPDPAKQGFWYDDYGWFGNAFARAAQIASLLDDQTKPTRAEAIQLAETVWNNYATTFCNYPQWCPGCFSDPGRPKGCNTVTNALYLDFSMRLYDLTKNGIYLTSAQGQYALFLNWIGQASDGLLTNNLNQTVNLVRWGNGSDYVDGLSNWVWIGNQGLLISGLNALLKYDQNVSLSIRVAALYKSAMDNLFDAKLILHEAPFAQTFENDPLDYATGKGVFIRFVAGSGIAREDVERITNTATAAFAALNMNTFRWSDSETTLDFQNKFLKMWDSTQPPLQSPMRWGAHPKDSPTFMMDNDMCVLDALVAAVRTMSH